MAEDFVQWALAPERTIEEAYCAELLTAHGLKLWKSANKVEDPDAFNWELKNERARQRRLNPAHRVALGEVDVMHAAEMLPKLSEFELWNYSEPERPLRDLTGLRFCPKLRKLKIAPAELRDLSGLAALPELDDLWLQDADLEDLSGLAACRKLKAAHIWLQFSWPDLRALAELPELEQLTLHGNLCALAGVGPLPKVRKVLLNGWGGGRAHLRNALDLPFMPALVEAQIYPWGRLDHIAERLPAVEELSIEGPYRSLEPLAALASLRKLNLYGEDYESVEPLARMKRLNVLMVSRESPIDFTPLLDSDSLREIEPFYNRELPLELMAINAALGGWDTEFALEIPRPLAPCVHRLIQHIDPAPPGFERPRGSRETPVAAAVQEAEGKWLARRIANAINRWHRGAEWGQARCSEHDAARFQVDLDIHDIEVADALPELVEICRHELAAVRSRWTVHLMVSPESGWQRDPDEWKDDVQRDLEDKIEEAHNRAKRRREYREYLEKLHRVKELEEQGVTPAPEEFAPKPPPKPDEEEDADVLDEDGSWDRDHHPRWQEYYMTFSVCEEGCWIPVGFLETAERLFLCPIEKYPGWTPKDEE